MTINFQKRFDEVSKLPVAEDDTLDDVLCRLGEKLCVCLNIERVNIWIFKQNPNRIDCIANYVQEGNQFTKGETLLEEQIPSYFSHLQSDKAIRITNVYTNPITSELKDNYCVDNHIFAIMDIPVRIEGKLAGVICFEDCKQEREWSDKETEFAMAVSQIVSLSIENYKRRIYEIKLKKALEEKNTLLVEMHHRLKNNLSILVSLLRIQARSVEDEKAIGILENLENQILSVSKLHEQLYKTGNYLIVNLKSYIRELITSIEKSYNGKIKFDLELMDLELRSSASVSLGLIINEVINNSIKHGLIIEQEMIISVNLSKVNNEMIQLSITDNGKGFEMNDEIKQSSFGLNLIYDLSEQIGAEIDFTSTGKGTSFQLTFS